MDKINLNTSTTESTPINLDAGPSTTQLPQEVVDKRAEKAHYGLQDTLEHERDDYVHAINNGQENAYRQEAAAKINANKASDAFQQIQNFVSQRATLKPEDADTIQAMAWPRQANADSVFEEQAARKWVDTVYSSSSPWFDQAVLQNPREVGELQDHMTLVGTRYAFARKMEEEYGTIAQQQSWGGYMVDWAKSFVPFYNSAELRGNIPGAASSFTLGGALEEQRKALFRLPLDEFIEQYPKVLAGIAASNPGAAAEFAHAMAGSSLSEQVLTSAGEISDALVAGSMFKKPLVAGARSILRGMPAMEVRPVRVAAAAAAGDMRRAAVEQATESAVASLTDRPNTIQNITDGLASGLKQDQTAAAANPGNFGGDILNRINDLTDKGFNFLSELKDGLYVNRTPALAVREVMDKQAAAIKGNWRGVDNSILDMSDPKWFSVGNIGYYRELRLGTPDGEMFDTLEVAQNNARDNGYVHADIREVKAEPKLKLNPIIGEDEYAAAQQNIYETPEGQPISHYGPGPGFTIEQQGSKYYINYILPISEIDDVMRDGLLELKGTDLPQSLFGNIINAAIGPIRTPDETLSKIENEQRKIATHTPSRFEELATDILKPIQGLRKNEWTAIDRLLRFNQSQWNSELNKMGSWFKSPGEVENWYRTNINRPPTLRELHAYWSVKTGTELDRVMREIAVAKAKWRQGAMSHTLTFNNQMGVPIKTEPFEAVRITHVPTDEYQIVVMNRGLAESEDHSVSLSHDLNPKFREMLQDEVDKGTTKLLDIWDPDLKPLKNIPGLENNHIRYIAVPTRNTEENLINFNAVPRLGGGHLVPDYDHFAKQAIIDRQTVGATHDIYKGDRTLGAVRNHAEGENWAKHMNEIRKFIKDGDINSAKAYAGKYMRDNWDTIYDQFKERRDPSGMKLPALIDKDMPIMVVRRNQTTLEHPSRAVQSMFETRDPGGKVVTTFKDGTKSGNRAKMSQIEFTGERNISPDFFSIESTGTQENPLFTYQPAKFIDPITMLNRGLSRIIKSTFMDDYKTFAVEHFVQASKDLLDVESMNHLRNSPFYHLFQQGGPRFKNPAGITERVLQGNWKKVRDFIGIPSETDNFMRSISEKLQDSIYRGGGAKGAKIADTMVPSMKDPIPFVQKMTYHFAMGLFSIPQFFTQLSTHTNLFALAPKYASQGSLAMLLHSWSTWNESPQIMAHLDKLASRMGWKPGHWLEANREFIRSGFGNIGGEHVFQDTPWSAKLLQSGTDKFLNWGETPFKLGAKSIRTSSYYTAYLEWRSANPTAELDRASRAKILDRATLFDHNQSRASSSALNHGWLRPAFQFQSYALRLSEMMTGKRLTKMEKARLFGVSSVLYGVPVGGLGLYFFPTADYANRKLTDEGYVIGNNALADIAVHGLGSEIMHFITGNRYNIEKFGAKGVDVLGTGLDGDKTWMDMFGGAGYSLAKNFLNRTTPYTMWAHSVINGDQERFPITSTDVLDAAKTLVTSVRHANQGYVGVTTHQWVSSNDNYLMDVSAVDAFFMSLTGVSPLEVPQSYLTQKAIKDRDDVDKVTLVNFLRSYHRMTLAYDNPDLSKKFGIQAAAFLAHYPEEKKAAALKMAFDSGQPYIDRVKFDYFMKDVDPTVRDKFRQIYQNTQQGNK